MARSKVISKPRVCYLLWTRSDASGGEPTLLAVYGQTGYEDAYSRLTDTAERHALAVAPGGCTVGLLASTRDIPSDMPKVQANATSSVSGSNRPYVAVQVGPAGSSRQWWWLETHDLL
jgi:hypothetical protein